MRSQTILVVEDNAITRKVVRLALGCEGFDVVEATSANEALSSIEIKRPDLILQDLRLADMNGIDLVAQLRTLPGMAAVPIIAFSSFLSRLGAHAAACGFTDVLAKPVEPSRLVQLVHKHLPDTTVRDRAPAERRRAEANAQLMQRLAVAASGARDLAGMFELIELVKDVIADDDKFLSFASTMMSQLASVNGRKLALETVHAIEESLRRSDAQLRQSQKMEAVGTLAAGIAHDFNNALAVVLSYGEMILAELPADASIREDVEEICNAGRSASNLTRQLLTFSRQQVVEPRVIDLGDVLVGFGRMLGRVLGADIELVSVPTPGLGMVWIDPGSLEQVILNLAVNARDAMPNGGRLTIETANLDLDDGDAHGPFGVSAGPHVMLAVTDTGIGMDALTRSRIFEPFYTTKPHGKGTGLGLSTVFGIIQQSGGAISVRSEPGAGTRFEVYLPRIDGVAPAPSRSRSPSRPIMTNARGTETVMIVEDADQVRAVAANILRRSGYTVIEARNPNEAMQLLEQSTRVDLLLSDVVMPKMSGPMLAHRVSSSRPDIKILQMSGYEEGSSGLADARFAYLQKPFTPETLTRKVREILDRRPR